MSRAEFMTELRMLLADVTETEREEAINYYEDYFDDAGVENEASVLESLGTPEKVAATIKAGLNDETGENAEYSESGYSSFAYEKNEVANMPAKKWSLKNGLWIIILILCIFALPIMGPVCIAILGAMFGVLCAAAVLLFAVCVSGIAIIVAGVFLLIAGFMELLAAPFTAILLFGIGLILLGIGVAVAALGIWILKKAIPPLVRGFVNLCRRPFERKRG